MNADVAAMIDEEVNAGMSAKEASKHFGLSIRTIYRAIESAERSRSHLTPEQVREIKARLASDEWGVGVALAREYKVTTSTISQIKKGKLHADIN